MLSLHFPPSFSFSSPPQNIRLLSDASLSQWQLHREGIEWGRYRKWPEWQRELYRAAIMKKKHLNNQHLRFEFRDSPTHS